MKNVVRLILCFLILGGGYGIRNWMIANKPEPERRPRPPSETYVDAMTVKPIDFQVEIKTQGEVQPRTETVIIPQVSGTVVYVDPAFRDGGFFEKDQVLLRIERADYESALTIAQATVARARLQIDQEQARGQQARREWTRMNKEGEPSALLLRKPQLEEAKAVLSSAIAQEEKAERDLTRTEILAPYAGRVLEDQVDVGQVVSPGTRIGRIYAIDYVEIPMPLSNHQLSFVDVPEAFRGEGSSQKGPAVSVEMDQGDKTWTYEGRLVRTSGAVDSRSRQTSVVAQVDDPYSRKGKRPPLKVGMFVQATIQGRTLHKALVLPQIALREGRFVLLVDEDNRLHRQEVELQWTDREQMVVTKGIKPGDVVCLTPIAYAVNEARVIPTIDGVQRMLPDQKPRTPGGPGKPGTDTENGPKGKKPPEKVGPSEKGKPDQP